jgi:hypothetical protein
MEVNEEESRREKPHFSWNMAALLTNSLITETARNEKVVLWKMNEHIVDNLTIN